MGEIEYSKERMNVIDEGKKNISVCIFHNGNFYCDTFNLCAGSNPAFSGMVELLCVESGLWGYFV